MRNFLFYLFGALQGLLFSLAVIANTAFVLPFILVLAFIKLLPLPLLQKQCQHGLNYACDYWVMLNNIIAKISTNIELNMPDNISFSKHHSYIVLSNHQSWLDIVVLQYVLYLKIPVLKFFLKDSLKWVPLLGLCWWALDFPFMKRYSKVYLEKHPEKKGQDLVATKKACEKFKVTPVSIMNYPEGTRFTKEKHQQQNSPFINLLKPKAGGVAYALPILGKRIKSIIDVSVCYPSARITLWDFLCGRVSKVKVELREIEIPETFYSMDYANDLKIRQEFQYWLNDRWHEKDKLLSKLKDQM